VEVIRLTSTLSFGRRRFAESDQGFKWVEVASRVFVTSTHHAPDPPNFHPHFHPIFFFKNHIFNLIWVEGWDLSETYPLLFPKIPDKAHETHSLTC
jgi:hypothetical protein